MPSEIETPTPPQLVRARALSRVLDDLIPIPGTSWRVGLDPLLGLVPGMGDWVSWTVSLHLLWGAARLGAGPTLLMRMLGNLALDAATGAVPLLGDLFDMGWKANARNLALLETFIASPQETRAQSRVVVGGILVASVGLVAASIGVALWVLRWTVGLVI